MKAKEYFQNQEECFIYLIYCYNYYYYYYYLQTIYFSRARDGNPWKQGAKILRASGPRGLMRMGPGCVAWSGPQAKVELLAGVFSVVDDIDPVWADVQALQASRPHSSLLQGGFCMLPILWMLCWLQSAQGSLEPQGDDELLQNHMYCDVQGQLASGVHQLLGELREVLRLGTQARSMSMFTMNIPMMAEGR